MEKTVIGIPGGIFLWLWQGGEKGVLAKNKNELELEHSVKTKWDLGAPKSQLSSQAQQLHLPVLRFLLFQGRCDVNVKNNRNQSPLHLAVIQGHVGMVQLLVSQGSDVNAEDEDGDTAMHIALERQQLMALAMEKREGEMGAALLSKVSSSRERLCGTTAAACGV